jgi:tetratricopeptide (TPR) repeat protein
MGAEAEAELLLAEFDLKKRVEIEMFEMMARAFSRTAQYSKSLEYFERLLKLYDPIVEKRSEHTRTNMRIADMHVITGHVDKAKVIYKKVYAIGEMSGDFEFHSKSCLGLSKIEKEAGNKTEAMALAQQALLAAELLLNGEYSKSRDSAQAIIAIIDFSDITSESFDETLLVRLEELTTAVDKTEYGGSSLVVKSAELQCIRHFYQARWLECSNACVRVMQLAKEERFKQTPDIQSVYARAFQMIESLHGLGIVAINPER